MNDTKMPYSQAVVLFRIDSSELNKPMATVLLNISFGNTPWFDNT